VPLKRIETYNPTLNAFITVTRKQALTAARQMDAEQRPWRGNWRGPLHGIPIALKDNMDTAGIRTTAASELFKDRVPTEDAEFPVWSVERPLEHASACLSTSSRMGCLDESQMFAEQPGVSVLSALPAWPLRKLSFRRAWRELASAKEAVENLDDAASPGQAPRALLVLHGGWQTPDRISQPCADRF